MTFADFLLYESKINTKRSRAYKRHNQDKPCDCQECADWRRYREVMRGRAEPEGKK